MIKSPGFPDLMLRVQSAFVLVAIGLGAFWLGGDAVVILLTLSCALMGWEVAAMHGDKRSAQIAVAAIAGIGFMSVFFISGMPRLIYVVALAVLFLAGKFKSPLVCLASVVAIVEISLILEQFNWKYGFVWTFWLIAVVAATDIGGYFAGRFIGGPKVWPAVSPKKTWAGVIGGWVLALIVSGLFMAGGYGSLGLLLLTVLVSITSQAGDFAESAVKRRAGVKDASDLIPGHGGLLDRFDGLLGACLGIGIASALGLLPDLGISG